MVDSGGMPENALIGLQHLKLGAYYEAHEYFEDAWRQTDDDSREFYRVLLHISGGFYRLGQDRSDAANKFFSRALYWLGRFPDGYLGFDLATIRDFLENMHKIINDGTPNEIILKNSQSIIQAVLTDNQSGTS